MVRHQPLHRGRRRHRACGLVKRLARNRGRANVLVVAFPQYDEWTNPQVAKAYREATSGVLKCAQAAGLRTLDTGRLGAPSGRRVRQSGLAHTGMAFQSSRQCSSCEAHRRCPAKRSLEFSSGCNPNYRSWARAEIGCLCIPSACFAVSIAKSRMISCMTGSPIKFAYIPTVPPHRQSASRAPSARPYQDRKHGSLLGHRG